MYERSSWASRSKATKDAGVDSSQLADALLGRVDALGQCVEVEALGPGDDDLSVEHAAGRELAPECLDELGEVRG